MLPWTSKYPRPHSDTANQMKVWTQKGKFQSKRAERQTYLDEIVAKEKK